MKCESFMEFQQVESPSDRSLGIRFACPSCGAKIAMVTNSGETAMVQALGVQIGGRTAQPGPMEFTRESMKEGMETPAIQQKMLQSEMAKSHAAAGEGKGGSCPFASMVAKMQGGTSTADVTTPSSMTWTKEARERLERVPSFMRPMIEMGIENYAKKNGLSEVTPAVMDASKNDMGEITWPKEAEARLDNIPSFVRPMARKEIERIARERGLTTITNELLEETKAKFIGLGY